MSRSRFARDDSTAPIIFIAGIPPSVRQWKRQIESYRSGHHKPVMFSCRLFVTRGQRLYSEHLATRESAKQAVARAFNNNSRVGESNYSPNSNTVPALSAFVKARLLSQYRLPTLCGNSLRAKSPMRRRKQTDEAKHIEVRGCATSGRKPHGNVSEIAEHSPGKRKEPCWKRRNTTRRVSAKSPENYVWKHLRVASILSPAS